MSIPPDEFDRGPHADPALVPDTINGFTVKMCDHMAGAKEAHRIDSTLYVSPAMWKLIHAAESEGELRLILNSIWVRDLSRYITGHAAVAIYPFPFTTVVR